MKPIHRFNFVYTKCFVLLSTFLNIAAEPAETPSSEPPAGTTIVHPIDRAIMVYIPAGEFIMGVDEEEGRKIAADLGQPFESLWIHEAYPKRRIHLPGFFIDRYEVTVEQWKRFLEATGEPHRPKETVRWFDVSHARLLPAAEISWSDARRYAEWAGKTLPTEAQWEKAARGTDGRLYPWGNEPPTPQHGHFGI